MLSLVQLHLHLLRLHVGGHPLALGLHLLDQSAWLHRGLRLLLLLVWAHARRENARRGAHGQHVSRLRIRASLQSYGDGDGENGVRELEVVRDFEGDRVDDAHHAVQRGGQEADHACRAALVERHGGDLLLVVVESLQLSRDERRAETRLPVVQNVEHDQLVVARSHHHRGAQLEDAGHRVGRREGHHARLAHCVSRTALAYLAVAGPRPSRRRRSRR